VPLPSRAVDLWQIELQDQHGATFTFSDFLGARPTILSFFYTRCMNPNKCSLTVTKLARLQRQSQAKGWCGLINIAAITYDPAYDLPHRLHAYGANRGMIFDLHTRLMRTTGSFEPLRQGLRLGVGYGPTTVNQHRLDTLIFDAAGDPVMNLARVQWHESDVLHALEALLRGTERPTPRSR
jgi:protein SCO1/2